MYGVLGMSVIKTQIYCLLFLLFIAIVFFRTKRPRTKASDCFGILIIATSVNLLFDLFSAYAVNHLDTTSPFVNRLFHDVFLGSIICCLYLHSLYINYMVNDENSFHKRPPMFLSITLIAGILGIIFAPLYYKETDTVNYAYGPAVYTCYICMGVYVLISLTYLVTYYRKITLRKRMIISGALGIYLLCAGYQSLFPTSLVSGLGMTLVVFAIFLTLEGPDVHMSEMLQLEKKYILEADVAKSNFMAQISHEFRTPINAILGMDEMILREYDEPQLNEYAITIYNSGKALLNQINNILDYTKIEFGMTQLVEEEYDLCALCGELVEMTRARLQDKNIKLITEIDENLPATLYGDNVKLRQIISNLLTNAVKYTNDGEIIFRMTQKGITLDSVTIEVSVKDTGIGIRREDIPKLFESFRRLDEQRNHNVEGTGLGMCITQKYLELMYSSLKVSSTYGEGSEFSFIISQNVIGTDILGDFERGYKSLIESRRNNHGERFSAPDANVMIVDDNTINRVVFESLLKNTGIHITSLESGEECLNAITETHYDIIFLDHMMPNMDGIETLRRMRQSRDHMCTHTPVIMLTANKVTSSKNIYSEAGFDDYLAKPVLPEELQRIILMYLPSSKIKEPIYNSEHTKKKYISLCGLLGRIDGFDPELAMKNCASEEILLQAVIVFNRSVDYFINTISGYLQQIEDTEARMNYTIEVHSIKSSIRLIGGVVISQLAEDLEAAGRSGNLDYIREMTPALFEKLQVLKLKLEMCIPKQKRELIVIADDERKEMLGQLKEAMEILDVDKADELIEKLSRHEWKDTEKGIFELLQNAVVNLDSENTNQLVGKLLER